MNGGQFKALKEDFEEVWESVTVGEKEVKKKARRRFRRASVGVMAVGIAQDEGTHAVHSGDGEDGEPPRKRNRPKFAERRAWAIPGQRVRVRQPLLLPSTAAQLCEWEREWVTFVGAAGGDGRLGRRRR